MAQKTVEIKKYKSKTNKASNEIDVNQKGIIYIDDKQYFVDGIVAKYILSLLEELDVYEAQLELLEGFLGKHGES
jgi:hypothetical protein|tara:strand:+ start:172 stop:396 length:225 start_codon:yes stop_codon:yes gene_type:complete